MCAFCCGVPEAKANDGRHVCPDILECKFMKKAGFEVKARPKAASATELAPEEEEDADEAVAVPAAASGGAPVVQSESTEEEWNYADDKDLTNTYHPAPWGAEVGAHDSPAMGGACLRELAAPPVTKPKPNYVARCSKPRSPHRRRSTRTPACSHSTGALNLPKAVQAALDTMPSHATPSSAMLYNLKKALTIADNGATNHMFPDMSVLISYHRSSHIQVHLGSNTFTPVLGTGTAIISLNGKRCWCKTLSTSLVSGVYSTAFVYTSSRRAAGSSAPKLWGVYLCTSQTSSLRWTPPNTAPFPMLPLARRSTSVSWTTPNPHCLCAAPPQGTLLPGPNPGSAATGWRSLPLVALPSGSRPRLLRTPSRRQRPSRVSHSRPKTRATTGNKFLSSVTAPSRDLPLWLCGPSHHHTRSQVGRSQLTPERTLSSCQQ